MSHDSPPGSARPTAGGEFTWPPTREELDAIDVIPLDDTSSIKPITVVPAKTMVSPATGRRGRLRLPLRLPRRDDFVFAGAIGTSVLAIAVAASMQFSDLLASGTRTASTARPVRTARSTDRGSANRTADRASAARDVTDRDRAAGGARHQRRTAAATHARRKRSRTPRATRPGAPASASISHISIRSIRGLRTSDPRHLRGRA